MADLQKKRTKGIKQNCRPGSFLPALLAVYERSMFKQMSSFYEDILCKCQYSFRKGFSKQQSLILLLEKSRIAVNKSEVFGALLINLSKTFDCLNHDLPIEMPNTYSFTSSTFRLIHKYLSSKKQRVQVNNSYFLSWFVKGDDSDEDSID